jgi:uncharacterized membrane protein YjjB (DUF3815 family)
MCYNSTEVVLIQLVEVQAMSIFYQVLAGFLGTVAFAVLFEAPPKHYLYCGAIGAVGWLVYLVMFRLCHLSSVWATFLASLVLIYLSREAAYALRAPVTIFLICGIFCLVPGIGIYNFTYAFFLGDSYHAAQLGIHVLKIAIAISLGISVGYELSPKCFFAYRKHQRMRQAE